MATLLQNTVAFEENDLFSLARKPLKRQHKESVDLRPRLTAILQRTLDLSELLTLFYQEVQQLVASNSCHYHLDSENIEVNLGKKATHSCCYRLLTKDDYLGEVTFTRKTRFTKPEIKQLEDCISTLIYPIRNALRYREAIKSALTDSLTSAGNRVAFENSFQRELDLADRYKTPLSVLMVDLDHFKLVNDTYGHAAGDEVLKTVVQEIKQTTRCADMTFRFGGEEFVVLLNKTNEAGARIIAERLRAAIAGLSCVYDQTEIPITISIGCATLKEGEDKEQLLERADKSVYEAKAQGRNRVISAEVLEMRDQIRH